MKVQILAMAFLVASSMSGFAVAITLGQTAGAARFFTFPGQSAVTSATVSMGWMSDPDDGKTFIEFASTAMHGNTVFSSGIGTIAGNSSAAELTQAAGKNVYIRAIDTGRGGIWMS